MDECWSPIHGSGYFSHVARSSPARCLPFSGASALECTGMWNKRAEIGGFEADLGQGHDAARALARAGAGPLAGKRTDHPAHGREPDGKELVARAIPHAGESRRERAMVQAEKREMVAGLIETSFSGMKGAGDINHGAMQRPHRTVRARYPAPSNPPGPPPHITESTIPLISHTHTRFPLVGAPMGAAQTRGIIR